MSFGFSYVGLIFLLALFIPNLFWTKNKPRDYEHYVGGENKLLQILERIGEIAVVCVSLIFSDFNINKIRLWSLWLLGAVILMLLYEVWWIRYFRSEKTMRDFYSDLFFIPVAGASLPVAAFVTLAVYGKNLFLFAAAVILGIGHIGIHLGHKREVL